MAHEPAEVRHKTPTLPPQVTGLADVGRLLNELHMIDETLLQLELRKGGSEVKMPKTTKLMDLTVEHNKLNLLKEPDRQLLKKYLELAKDKAPRMHFSFGADPSVNFTEKLVSWLRTEIHPHILITIGLQPGIGAGCKLRTTNKYFDFSLGHTLSEKQDLLLSKLLPPAEKAIAHEQ